MLKWLSKIFGSKSSGSQSDKRKEQIAGSVRNSNLRHGIKSSEQLEIPPKKLPRGPDRCYTEPGKCYRCGKPSIKGGSEIVHFYDNVRVGVVYPQVEFDAKTVEFPLCKDCSEHEVEHGWGYFIYLQMKGVNGWKQGKGPSKSEIDAVWHAHLHPVKNVWVEALANLKKEKAQKRMTEAHIFDKPIATIDQYEILKKLGTGGFGAVFLARDSISKILVAVKGLPEEINRHDEEKESLKKNFALIAKLHHPNIASPLVLHLAEKVNYREESVEKALQIRRGDFFLVMEFARGDTLSRWRGNLRGERLEDFADVIKKIAVAIDFAHEKGILHRDIKPNNIMVYRQESGELDVKVLDFGLAAELKLSLDRLECKPRGVSGTLPYMSPEQWRGETLGVGTDIYALAVVAYELLQGTVPFASAFQTGNQQVMYAAVSRGNVDYPCGIWPEMNAVLQRGLAKKFRNRYFSCVEFAEDYAKAIAIYLKRKQGCKTPINSSNDGGWRAGGNILAHPLNQEINQLVDKVHRVGYMIIGIGNEYHTKLFWQAMSKIVIAIPPSRLLHSNEILALDFSSDMDEEEQLVFDISEEFKKRYGSYSFAEVWKGLILWAKMIATVILKYSIYDDGVYECMLARKRKHDEIEGKRKNENFKLKDGSYFIGNPFYQEQLGPDTVICDYYLAQVKKGQ